MKDIEAVADQVLADGICKLDQHRGDVSDAEVTDLHIEGLCALGTTEILQKYVEKVVRDRMFIAETLGDALEVEDETHPAESLL
jgi:hypothetical protein